MLAVQPVALLATVPVHRVMGGQTGIVSESVRNATLG